jgi:hypothetical protein
VDKNMSFFDLFADNHPMMGKIYICISYLLKRFFLGYWTTLRELDAIHQELFNLRNDMLAYRQKREAIEGKDRDRCKDCPLLIALEENRDSV